MDYKQLFFCAMDGIKVMENGVEILEIDKSDLKKENDKLKAEIDEIKSQGWENTMVVLRDSEIEELKEKIKKLLEEINHKNQKFSEWIEENKKLKEENDKLHALFVEKLNKKNYEEKEKLKEENEELKVNIKKFKKQVEELAELNNIPFTKNQLEEINGYGMSHPDEVYDKDYLHNHLCRFLHERDVREDWIDPRSPTLNTYCGMVNWFKESEANIEELFDEFLKDNEEYLDKYLDEEDEERIGRVLSQDLKNFAIEVHNELYGTKYDDEDIVESFAFDELLKKFEERIKGVN